MDDLKRGGASITSCRRRRKGAGAKPAGSSGRRGANPQALVRQCMRIDKHFQHFFDTSVWNQVSEHTQRQLHSLHSKYQDARIKVDRMPAGDEQARDAGFVADELAEVEEGLEEVEAKSRASNARGSDVQDTTPFRDFHKKRAPDLPWQVIRVAILAVALQWFFMMVASAAEAILGPESLLKPPGEPPWIRDQKMRSWTPEMVHLSNNKTLPENYKLFDPPLARPPLLKGGRSHSAEHGAATEGAAEGGGHGAGGGHGGDAHHRRLTSAYGRRPDAALGELLEVLPSIGRLAAELQSSHGSDRGAWQLGTPAARGPADAGAAQPAFMAPAPRALPVSWPSMFEPRHLVCSPLAGEHRLVAALTPHGFGALVPHTAQDAGAVEAQPFALEGLGGLGPLVGAAWAKTGLRLVTRAGRMLHCPGHAPSDAGTWACELDAGLPLPLQDGARLLAAAVGGPAEGADAARPGRLAALLLEELPEQVALFADEGSGAGWSPAGEVHLPPGALTGSARVGLSLAGEELLITTGTGEAHRRHVRHGTSTVYPTPGGHDQREFHSSCSLPTGELLRLALRQAVRPSGGLAWGPELFAAGA
uniref:Uncharacterized protein n=1 Tax=Alexandrium monilatum TaxID=311494 RepID=A0A7S4Q506_9DINO